MLSRGLKQDRQSIEAESQFSAAAETMLLAIPVIFLSPWPKLQLKDVKGIERPMKVENALFLTMRRTVLLYSGF